MVYIGQPETIRSYVNAGQYAGLNDYLEGIYKTTKEKTMGYKLKKDLPFAKAGTKVDRIRSSKGTDKLSFIGIGDCKCQLPDEADIFDWIEEVKPKEVADECINSLQKVIDKLKIAERKAKSRFSTIGKDTLLYAQALIKSEIVEFQKGLVNKTTKDEVKPKEFVLMYDGDRHCIIAEELNPTSTLADLRQRIMKVREIIE